MATRGTRWEASRLGNRVTDWTMDNESIPMTRTRHGGKRTPQSPEPSPSSTSDEEYEQQGEDEEEEDEDDEARLLKEVKPLHQRVIVEARHLEDAIEQFSKCPECNGRVEYCLYHNWHFHILSQ